MMENFQSNIADISVPSFLNGNKLRAESKQMRDIFNAVSQCVEEGKIVRLDFSGAGLSNIHTDEKFKELLLDTRFQNVFMRFRGEEQLVRTLKLLLKMSRRNEERVLNVENQVQNSNAENDVFSESIGSKTIRTALEANGIEVLANDGKIIVHYTSWNGNTVLSSMNTVQAVIGLYNAIKNKLESTGLMRADVDFGSLTVSKRSDSVGDMLQVAKNRLTDLGYTIFYRFDNKDTEKQWNTAVILAEAQRTEAEILKELDTYLKIGTVGILAEYVPTEKRRDRLGRVGKGAVATRQPAIYLGHTDKTIKIRRYNLSKFLRRADWDRKLMQDAEYLVEFGETPVEAPVFHLGYKDMEIPIDKVGMCKFSYGSHFHFSLPVQQSENEFENCWAYNKVKDSFNMVKVPLPVFIELVFDENSVDYNVEELQNCISYTEECLKDKGISVENLDDYDFDKRS